MRLRKLAGMSALILSLSAIGATGSPVGAASGSFGARLDSTSQPSNAENGQPCDDNAGIPDHGTCTWVSTQAYRNGATGDRAKAPKTGTVKHLKLVSCIGGSFVLQFAKQKSGTQKFKIVRSGPTIHYAADTQGGGCGGNDQDTYIVQSFKINVHVNKGEYIAIKTKKTGALYCSGGSGVKLYSPPLAVGGSYKNANGGASCNLLVELFYS